MKASFKFILAALAATAVSVSCTKDVTPDFENDKVNPAAEGSRIIAVSFAPQTKTILDGLQPKFEDGKDTVLISNTNALDTCVVSVKDKKATISTDLTGPLTAVYPYKAAKMSEGNENEIDTVLVSTVQSGKFADANICMARMRDGKDESLSFENKTALFKIIPGAGESTQYVEVSADGFEIANDVPTGSTHTSLETIHVNTTSADSVYVSILVPVGLTVGDLKFSDGTNVKTVTGEKAATAIAAGTLYTVTNANWESTEADIPEPLEGVFTVSDNGTPTDTTDDIKVHFSQGNLVAIINESGTPTAWKFATNQYDYLGEGGANNIGNTTTSGTAGDVDLFGWSTSDNSGVSTTDNYGIKTSTSATGYSGTFYDWGKAIGDGNTWRTLSTAEWQYLFNSRSTTTNTGTTNARYAKATVNSKAGIILLPDAYTHPSVVTALTNINTNNAAFTVNTYDVTAWEAMESAGAVFLPAAGYRYGSNVYNVGRLGFYWSSTANGSSAYLVNFNGSNVSPDYSDVRYNGSSVRLVTNVSAAPTPTEPDYVVMKANVEGTKTLKWATKNLGAATETDFGKYFGWGDKTGYALTSTAAASPFDGSTINNAFEGAHSFSTKPSIDGETQNPTTLPVSNDAARINWGGDWRMPTKEDFKNLYEACGGTSIPQSGGSTSTTEKGVYWCANYDGVAGCLFCDGTNKLFFPAAGYGNDTDLRNAGSSGYYWSSSLNTGTTVYAYHLYFRLGSVAPQFNDYRYGGFSVRPVSDK